LGARVPLTDFFAPSVKITFPFSQMPPVRRRTAAKNVISTTALTMRTGVRRGPSGAYSQLKRINEFRNPLTTATRRGTVKAFVQSVIRFARDYGTASEETVLLNISTKARIVEGRSGINAALEAFKQEIDAKIDMMNEQSGLTLIGLDGIRLVVTKYQPQGGGTYIPLPDSLKAKKVLINIQNTDNYCFLYCLLAHKHKDEIRSHPERPSVYNKWRDEFRRLAGMCLFPMDPDSPDVARIESWYKLPINIFVIDDSGAVTPRRISRIHAMSTVEGQQSACNLLLISDGEKQHYVYITRLNALCARGRVAKRGREVVADEGAPLAELLNRKPKRRCKRGNEEADLDKPDEREDDESESSEEEEERIGTRDARHLCCFCLNGFTTAERLKDHIDGGCGSGDVNCVKEIYPTELPDGGVPTIHWQDGCKQAKQGLIRVYADFESIMENEAGYEENLVENASATRQVSVHKVCSAAYYVVAPGTSLNGVQWLTRATADQHCGDVIVTRFIYSLFDLYKRAKETMKGLECLPVFFHNLSGYDGHFLTRALGRIKGGYQNLRKTVIAKNTETFAMIALGPIRFLDSYSLLGPGMGLATAVSNLTDGGKDFSQFPNTRHVFSQVANEALLYKKGEYPYDYFTSVSKFEERALPDYREFRSKLDCEVTKEELQRRYATAQEAWTAFGCRSLADYHDMYLLLDVVLLADVFEAHRNMCLAEYGLDPGNGVFVSLPNFSWFAMLKKTGVRLEQITNPDIYQMIERGKRGGQAIITHRHAVANNRYMESWDRSKEESYILYLDANNLYGWAMSRKLPISDFRFATTWQVAEMLEETSRGVWKIKDLPEDTGAFLEVDLDYPEGLHDAHNDYPLAPEQMAVKDTQLSPTQCSWLVEMGKFKNADSDKLCGTLLNKRKYVIHVDLLRFYLKHGLVLRHVHRVVLFKQEAWLEPYIRFNTERRAVAVTKATKEFYKLLNNAVFGKTMENVRNRSNLQLVTDRKSLIKMVSKPHYKEGIIFREDDEDGNFLVGVAMHTTSVKLDKPIYAGVSILDLSKLHMYGFHYERVKPLWGERAKLLFTDTDSLCYWVKTGDAYGDMIGSLLEEMDMSETAKEKACSFYGFLTDGEKRLVDENARANKKVLGKFKDETGGVPITEFVGLRAKCYSFVTEENHTESKAKGVNKHALKAYLTHQDYRDVLMKPVICSKATTFHSFRSLEHVVSTVEITKQALNKYDDKRFILEDGIHSRAHGHYRN
jgi:hypothetical protein